MNDLLPIRYQNLVAQITQVEHQAGRKPGSVQLVAVSKGQPEAAVQAALALGLRRFGENRVQEAERKFAGLRAEPPDLELHLIGRLQTNKVRAAVALFDVIETVDRPELVTALAAAIQAGGHRPRLLVQVNTGREPQKAGVMPDRLEALLEDCRAHGLVIAGLMCIPPLTEPSELHFAMLASLAKRYGLAELSMGMSADFPAAIAAGATYIRVGTALFGSREVLPAN